MGLFLGDSQPSKIFVGDTPISKVFLGDTQVRPSGGGWQPGANTLFYCNIDDSDTTTTIHDKSGNNRDLTWFGNGAYTTDANAGKVAVFDGASYASLGGYINPQTTAYTILVWGKWISGSGQENYVSQGSSSSRIHTIGLTPYHFIFANPANSTSWLVFTNQQPQSSRGLVVGVRDDDKIYGYYNGQPNGYKTKSNIQTNWTSGGYFQLGANRQQYDFLIGQIKAVIFENKARTAGEISDYYDQTKSNYGL